MRCFLRLSFIEKNNRISDFSIINKELSFTNKKGFAFYQKKELWNNHKWMVPIFISLVKSLFNRNAPWINLAFWATKWCEVKNLGFIETFIILVSQLLSDPAWFWWQLSSCCAVIGLESNSTGSVVHVYCSDREICTWSGGWDCDEALIILTVRKLCVKNASKSISQSCWLLNTLDTARSDKDINMIDLKYRLFWKNYHNNVISSHKNAWCAI